MTIESIVIEKQTTTCINELKGVKVEKHRGTWYSLAKVNGTVNNEPKTFYLMEHEHYGDEAANIVIDNDNNLVVEDIHQFSDFGYIVENKHFNELYPYN